MFTPAAIQKLAPLAFGSLDGDLLLSNDAGHWARLGPADAADLAAGAIAPGETGR